MEFPSKYSWVEISRRALEHNIRAYRRLIGKKVRLMAVVKSNAYGHGAVLVSKICEQSRLIDWFGVASLEEALDLRTAGIKLPILVLSYFRPFNSNRIAQGIKKNISFIVYEKEQLKVLEQAARKVKKTARVHLKLETGMARLGLPPDKASDFLCLMGKSRYLKLEGIASHLATAESADQSFVLRQLNTFDEFINAHKSAGQNILNHIACSAAITSQKKSHEAMVRLGIGLYGLWSSRENRLITQKQHYGFSLRPVLTWKTRVIEAQNIKAGTSVGYDRTYKPKKSITMAVLPIGYFEGYDRKLSNQGHVLIRKTKCPIIGRICMNISMVDASKVKSLRVGDEVVILGRQGASEITADDIAKTVGTINYEVVTRINAVLPRICS